MATAPAPTLLGSTTAGPMKWWGWGDPGHTPTVTEHALEFLQAELGDLGEPRPPVALEDVALPESALPAAARDALVRAVGSDGVRDDREARVSHGRGCSYFELVKVRWGKLDAAPDAVVYPETPEQVAAVIDACAEHDVAIVPFGGGTSVVGGVEPLRGEHSAVISLALERLASVVALDEQSRTATLQGGLRVATAETTLNASGYTIGHFPQSYEFVTVGGCVVTRSAGVQSTGYGRMDDLVVGLRCQTPIGELVVSPTIPHSAAGPELRQLVAGSEGTLGVLTEATIRVRPRPEVRRWEAFMFRDFQGGTEALRELVQSRTAPDVSRLSDEEETRLSLAQAGESTGKKVLEGYLRLRRYAGGCLGVFAWEGRSSDVAARRARAVRVIKRHGGIALGAAPAEAWAEARFVTPYLRDDLLTRGVLAETLETVTTWSRLHELHDAVANALRTSLSDQGTPPIVGCHVSHLYPSGASLYFTVLARQKRGEEIEQWTAAKKAAGDAISAHHGSITHHHAIGVDHRPWLEREDSPVGIAMIRAAKNELDPKGIMNPGKLLPG
jgi:alkyldihydroxyacetonephosphate synthase